jgi:hypothetical protein
MKRDATHHRPAVDWLKITACLALTAGLPAIAQAEVTVRAAFPGRLDGGCG